jgi:Tc5 transposase DNA-binding domain
MASKQEWDVQHALFLSATRVFSSLGQAAKAAQVPESTAYHRRAGRVAKIDTHPRSCRLTADQEKTLALWIQDLQLQYAPPNYTAIEYMALQMALDNGDTRPIRPNWVYRFLKRHPNLVAGRN